MKQMGITMVIAGTGCQWPTCILKVATKGKNEIAMSEETIPLNKWTHVAATYSREEKSTCSLCQWGTKGETIAADPFKPTARDWHITSMLIGKSGRPCGPMELSGRRVQRNPLPL